MFSRNLMPICLEIIQMNEARVKKHLLVNKWSKLIFYERLAF